MHSFNQIYKVTINKILLANDIKGYASSMHGGDLVEAFGFIKTL
ncbi:MAG: hypothetical protein PHO80_03525 [Candidatus Gracilibacteria bacterium]|nr:hypothetical protein [Candidatus Gracilibacteria bacterium]MDD4530592.1 hypothetical protein [Candidatus Gracilibacteria bacterium]